MFAQHSEIVNITNEPCRNVKLPARLVVGAGVEFTVIK
jgi:hypothetical protein